MANSHLIWLHFGMKFLQSIKFPMDMGQDGSHGPCLFHLWIFCLKVNYLALASVFSVSVMYRYHGWATWASLLRFFPVIKPFHLVYAILMLMLVFCLCVTSCLLASGFFYFFGCSGPNSPIVSSGKAQ